jgi:GAF domain-containing protein
MNDQTRAAERPTPIPAQGASPRAAGAPEAGPLTEAERRRLAVALASNPGSMDAVIGILEESVERRLGSPRRAQLGADVGAALTRRGELDEQLRRCTAAMVAHLDAAFARIWVLGAGDTLELVASAGMYTHLDGPHSRVPVGSFKIGRIAQEKLPHLTNAVLEDPRVGDKAWAAREGLVAFAGYPLVVDGRLVGVMALFARQALGEATLLALESVADSIAVGIERKRVDQAREALISALERSNRERGESEERERQARQAAEALAADIAEQCRALEKEFLTIRTERDQALARLAAGGR